MDITARPHIQPNRLGRLIRNEEIDPLDDWIHSHYIWMVEDILIAQVT